MCGLAGLAMVLTCIESVDTVKDCREPIPNPSVIEMLLNPELFGLL